MDDIPTKISNLLDLPRRFREKSEEVGSTPADVVHRESDWRLLRYRPADGGPKYETPLLIVPSLINRHYVLDLLEGRSFVEYMVEQGHDVYMLVWNEPGDENRYLDFDTICDDYLRRARRTAARVSGAEKAHLMGYCLGGTMTAIHSAAHPDEVAGHIALAAPVAFDDDGLLTTWMNSEGFDVDSLVEATRNVPWPVLQFAFHMLQPTMNLKKLVYLWERAADDHFLDAFAALEIWSNDNVDVPGEAFRDFIVRLYREDRLIRGEFALSGRPVELADVDHPTLVISFKHDHIVPPAAAEPLAEAVGAEDCTHMHLPGGHVTSVSSTTAKERLWPKMTEWLAEHDAAADAPLEESARPAAE